MTTQNTQEATNPVVKLESDLLRFSPFRSWEIVRVVFPTTPDSDVVVPHTLTVSAPEAISYQVLQTNCPMLVYHVNSSLWTNSTIRLRATAGDGVATVLLTTSKTTVDALPLRDTTGTLFKVGGWKFSNDDVTVVNGTTTWTFSTTSSTYIIAGSRLVIPSLSGSIKFSLGESGESATLGVNSGGLSVGGNRLGGGVLTATMLSESINANQTDYSPTGWTTATHLAVEPTGADRTINSLSAGLAYTNWSKPGRIITIHNSSATYNLVLTHNDTLSTADNRFQLPDAVNMVLAPGEGATFMHATGWRPVTRGHVTASGLSVIGQNNSTSLAARLRFRSGSAQYNWQIGANVNFSDVFEITPSTATGGATFSTPSMTLTRTGDMEITGVLTADGVKFPSTQVASADANTLDDYEEGTWTPVIGGDGGTSGQTYNLQVGHYRKVGSLVYCTFFAQLSAKGTITGSVVISGLPFTSKNFSGHRSGGAVTQWRTATSYAALTLQVQENVTQMYVIGGSGTTSGNLVTGDLNDTSIIAGECCYIAEN